MTIQNAQKYVSFIKIIKCYSKCIIKERLYKHRTEECIGHSISPILWQMEMLQPVEARNPAKRLNPLKRSGLRYR
jgi:hypothetical protein